MRKSNSATRVLLTLCTFPTHWVSPQQETTASKNSNSVSLQSTSHALFYSGHLVMRSKRCAVQIQGITLSLSARERRNPLFWAPPEYRDLSTRHAWSEMGVFLPHGSLETHRWLRNIPNGTKLGRNIVLYFWLTAWRHKWRWNMALKFGINYLT